MNEETSIQNRIRVSVHKISPNLRLWRNNVGSAYTGKAEKVKGGGIFIRNPMRIKFGLCPGSADLVGFYSVVITPEMVGKKIAVFMAPEVKTEKGAAEKHQEKWLAKVKEMGGICGIVKSDDDVRAMIDEWKNNITK